jgi:hypothetical protein
MVGTGVREQPLWAADWRAIGTAIRLVVTSEAALPPGRVLLEAELAALDVACSRFREDSELVRLGASGGRPVRVSPLLAELVAVALQAAEATEGDVDPTVGAGMAAAEGPRVRLVVRRLPDWRDVLLDTDRGLLTVPDGVMLDLGATAKSWLADHAAAALAAELGCGGLVSLGGDIAVAGQPPAQGWRIRVQDITTHPDAPPVGPSAMVTIRATGGGRMSPISSGIAAGRRAHRLDVRQTAGCSLRQEHSPASNCPGHQPTARGYPRHRSDAPAVRTPTGSPRGGFQRVRRDLR